MQWQTADSTCQGIASPAPIYPYKLTTKRTHSLSNLTLNIVHTHFPFFVDWSLHLALSCRLPRTALNSNQPTRCLKPEPASLRTHRGLCLSLRPLAWPCTATAHSAGVHQVSMKLLAWWIERVGRKGRVIKQAHQHRKRRKLLLAWRRRRRSCRVRRRPCRWKEPTWGRRERCWDRGCMIRQQLRRRGWRGSKGRAIRMGW